MVRTLDEWADTEAPGLREDIQCHLDNAAPEDQARLILISVRQWAEQRKISRVVPSKRVDFVLAENIKVESCRCGGRGCLGCAP